MIYGYFQSTEGCDTAQGLSELFSICSQDDDFQDFEYKMGSYVERVRCLRKTSSKVCTETDCKVLKNQELSRDRLATSYQKIDEGVARRMGMSKTG